MGNEVVLFENEERIDIQGVADFLRQLADKLSTGSVVLQSGSQELVLTIPNNVVLEIKAEEELKKSKVKRSLEVEIEWTEGEEESGRVTLG